MATEPRATSEDNERWFRERFAAGAQRDALSRRSPASRSSRSTPRTTCRRSRRSDRAARASTPTRAGSTRRCTAAGCGPCASSPASAPPRRPTSASTTCSTHGQGGLSTAFDMPSLMGHDSDHRLSEGEVGREGVAIDTLDDMETLFRGIPLGDVTTSMTINAPAAVMLAFYVVAAERQGVAARAPGRHDPDGHPQGVHRPEGVVLPDRPGRCAWSRTWSSSARGGCRAGTRSRSPATTSARRARRRSRSWRSRSRTGSPTSSRPSSAGSTWTTSPRGSASSSTPTSTSSRRSPSTGPRAGSGRASCATPTARAPSARCSCAATRRPPASR